MVTINMQTTTTSQLSGVRRLCKLRKHNTTFRSSITVIIKRYEDFVERRWSLRPIKLRRYINDVQDLIIFVLKIV